MEEIRAPAFVTKLPIQINNKNIDTRFLICAIENENMNSLFRVFPSKKLDACELYTEIQLDREKRDNYILNVSLTLGSSIDFTLITIEVIDINDNAPYFIFSKEINQNTKKKNELIDGYFSTVSSLAPAGTHVITIKVNKIFCFNIIIN